MSSQGEETVQEAKVETGTPATAEHIRARSPPRLPMARTCTTDHRRAFSESEQRKLDPLDKQQHQQQQLFKFDEHQQFQHEWHGPVRRFEILKSATLGLVCPQNIQLSVVDVDVDAGIVHADHLTNLSTLPSSHHEPAFVTSNMKWWKQKLVLPPSFEIFPGTAHQRQPQHKWSQPGDAAQTGSEVTGQPQTLPDETIGHLYANPSADHSDVPVEPNYSKSSDGSKRDEAYPLAEIKYQGWQGFTRMSISLTLYNITPDMHYTPPATEETQNAIHDIRSHYTIIRKGWKREYILSRSPSSPNYKWHSPPRHNSEVLSMPAVDDGFDPANGNLLLEDSQGTLVAVYKQRRDYQVMGALTVFLANVAGGPSTGNLGDGNENTHEQGHGHRRGHGHGHGQGHGNTNTARPDERIPLKAVVASCLAVVMYERVGWQNLLGH